MDLELFLLLGRLMPAAFPLLLMGFVCSSCSCLINDKVAKQGDDLNISVVVASMVSSNTIVVGTNIYNSSTFIDYVETNDNDIDAILLREDTAVNGLFSEESTLYKKLSEIDNPLFIEGRDVKIPSLLDDTSSDGIRKVSISNRAWNRVRGHESVTLPEVKATLQWNAEDELYCLDRIEMGVNDGRVWLIHQASEDDDGTSTGIFIRGNW